MEIEYNISDTKQGGQNVSYLRFQNVHFLNFIIFHCQSNNISMDNTDF